MRKVAVLARLMGAPACLNTRTDDRRIAPDAAPVKLLAFRFPRLEQGTDHSSLPSMDRGF